MTESNASGIRVPSAGMAVMPIAALVLMLGTSVYLFGDGTTGGPGQIALIIAAVLAGIVGILSGHRWRDLEVGAAESIKRALPAIFILLMVGTLIGMWMLAGTIPYLVYIGLKIMIPEIFYIATVLLCAVISISIGSSWTTAGTVGVALIGIAGASGLSIPITAGAIISGAYFGDKLSPLSDTTNLAAAVTGTELFEHIRFLLWTTIPAITIALIIFAGLSLSSSHEVDQSRINSISEAIQGSFSLSIWLLIPLVLTLGLAALRQPAFTSLLAGAGVAALLALFTQPALLEARETNALETIWMVAANGYTSSSGHEVLDSLLSRGGMSSMLNTVWLIISAMFFGGMMEKSGALAVLVKYLLIGVHSGSALVRRAGLTSLAANLITSDQYLAIALPSRMYADNFEERKLATRNLSRALEDYGTVTSVLVPWNTCGAFMAATLGVATGDYLWFCFFNLASPTISYIYALFNFKIDPVDELIAEPA